MKYLIVGCGRVGATLAKLLTAEAHDVTVVDENPAAFKRLGTHFAGRVEVGTGIDYDVLKRAGAEDADGFVAVTDGDNRNVMAALIAQRMFATKKIVARIYDPPRGQLYRELGIETVCPTTIGAKIVRDKLMHMPYESVPSFDFGKISSLAVSLREPDAGLRVAEIEKPGLVRVAAVRRGGRVFVAAPDDVLSAGDEVNAIVAPEALSDFVARFAATTQDIPIKLSA
ncbi:MAG: NAD-binding protein [Candidatus Eremiobacteraeota bacterium]|nr:NAD-binding protein [Candidatus Eremiobacteraeota bacterium]